MQRDLGGRCLAANSDQATFGGNAEVPPKGQEEYQDHGPAADLNVHSINVQAVTCSADGTQASIFGQATINGSGTSTTGSTSRIWASPERATRTGSG